MFNDILFITCIIAETIDYKINRKFNRKWHKTSNACSYDKFNSFAKYLHNSSKANNRFKFHVKEQNPFA